MLVIDIKRAYFNAVVGDDEPPTFVELPPEDSGRAKGLVWQLRVHSYGTRNAGDSCHCEYSECLGDADFTKVFVLKLQQHFAIDFVEFELLTVLSHSNVIKPQQHIGHRLRHGLINIRTPPAPD